MAPKAGLWGSQPAFVTQSEGGGELVGDAAQPPAPDQLRQFTNSNPILVDRAESSLINQSLELRLRKKAGRSEVPPPPADKLRHLVTFWTRGGSFDLPC